MDGRRDGFAIQSLHRRGHNAFYCYWGVALITQKDTRFSYGSMIYHVQFQYLVYAEVMLLDETV